MMLASHPGRNPMPAALRLVGTLAYIHEAAENMLANCLRDSMLPSGGVFAIPGCRRPPFSWTSYPHFLT